MLIGKSRDKWREKKEATQEKAYPKWPCLLKEGTIWGFLLSCEATVTVFASNWRVKEKREECAIVQWWWISWVESQCGLFWASKRMGWNGDGADGTCQSQSKSYKYSCLWNKIKWGMHVRQKGIVLPAARLLTMFISLECSFIFSSCLGLDITTKSRGSWASGCGKVHLIKVGHWCAS